MSTFVKHLDRSKTKRGDTIIEAMFSFAIFSLVAIITVSMINLGVAASERSLELVTARNELNAQAEALRFIHSSYIAELSLPECNKNGATPSTQCQQYQNAWEAIIAGARSSAGGGADDRMNIEYPLSQCSKVYENENRSLVENHAFVINTRQVFSDNVGNGEIVVPARSDSDVFREAPLSARIVYTANPSGAGTDDSNTADQLSSLSHYTEIAAVEGLWIVAVKGPTTKAEGGPQYYDFFIETCWYGSNSPGPTSLDAVVRLYNPEGA